MNKFGKNVLFGGLFALSTLFNAVGANEIDGQVDVGKVEEIKVNENGVVVDLRDGKALKNLPTVYYDGDNPNTLNESVIYYDVDSGVEVIEGSVYSTSQSGSMSLSIDDAQMQALNYSPSFKQALTQKMTAKGKKVGALGGALPSLSVSGGSAWSQTRSMELNHTAPIGDTPAARNTTSYGLNLSQPLFKGGSILAEIRASKLYDEWVSEDIRRVRQVVAKTIRTQYYNTLYSEKLAKIYNEQAEISKEYWEKTKRRYEADDVPEIDVLKYEVQYKIAQANYIQAKSNYDIDRVNILRLIGAPLDTELTLTSELDFNEIDPGSEQTLTAQALQSRPEIKADRLNEDIQKENIKVAKSGLYPELSAVASWGQTNRWSDTYNVSSRGTDWTWSAGLQLNWDILAGGGQLVRSQIIQANAILDNYQFVTQDTADDVKEEVKSALLSLYSSVDWVKSQQENVTQAERVLKQETIKWDEGAGDYLQILDARDTLAQSQQLYWQGVATYKVSVVNLEYAIGKYQTVTNTSVQGYRVVKNSPKKRIKKIEKFSDESIMSSFEALAVPSDLDDAELQPAVNRKNTNSFDMNVVPAHVDSQVGKYAVKQNKGIPSVSAEKDEAVAGPKLFY